MHITQSSLSLASQHRLEVDITRQTVLEAAPTASFRALLIDGLRPAVDTQPGAVSSPLAEEDPAATLDKALQTLIKALFGHAKTAECNTETPPVASIESGPRQSLRAPQLEIVHTREEESCSFSASGNICLADGSRRQFDVGYAMERSAETTQLNIGAGLRDPLVLDYAAPSSALGDHEVEFDLDNDGNAETMRMPGAASALLFHDRDRNDKADNGGELFGPQSGNGFDELARLDDDGNGWIDSADAAYGDIKLWRMGSDGVEQVETLAAAGIGALSTHHASTPFTLKEKGEIVGQMRDSSVWLGEESGAGIVRQIDIATTAGG